MLLSSRFDNEVGISRGRVVQLGFTLDKTAHGWGISVGGIPQLVDLIARAGKVVVRVVQRDFLLVGTSADLEGLVVHSVVGVGVGIAESDVVQAVDALVEVPVTG